MENNIMIYVNGRFLTQKITGVQRFGIEVMKELDSIVKAGEVELVTPPGIINNIELKHIKTKVIGKKSNNFWTQVIYPAYVIKNKGISFTMSGLCPLIKPDYFVAHDITFIRYPESFSKSFRFVYTLFYMLNLNRCKKVFTVSNFSKAEISGVIGVNTDKFVVVSPSSSHLVRDTFTEVDLSKWNIQSKGFYLSVSSQNRHKNQKYILDLADIYPDKDFVIVGGDKIKSFQCVEQDERNNVIYTGYVTDDELFTLYKQAKGFMFPSLYEGFGLPPLEAITMGTERVAVSDIPVFREVYDKDAYYFNPEDIHSFQFSEFERIHISDETRKKYLNDRNWKNTASLILKTIQKGIVK